MKGQKAKEPPFPSDSSEMAIALRNFASDSTGVPPSVPRWIPSGIERDFSLVTRAAMRKPPLQLYIEARSPTDTEGDDWTSCSPRAHW
jgi:hypothetical protein